MPNKLSEIIPKEKPSLPKWVKTVFYSSLIMVVGLAGAGFLIRNKITVLEQKKQDLKNQILTPYEAKEQKNLYQELGASQNRIKAFQKALRGHKSVVKFFPWFNSFIHPQAQVLNLEVDVLENKASFSVRTSDPVIAGEQILILREQSGIRDLQLSDISLAQKGAEFNVNITFDSEIIESGSMAELLPPVLERPEMEEPEIGAPEM